CILLAFGVFRNTVAAIAAASISAGFLLPLIAGSPYRMELQVLAGIISQFFYLSGICVALRTTRNLYFGFTWGALVGSTLGGIAALQLRYAIRFGFTPNPIQAAVFCLLFLVGWRVLEKRRRLHP